MYKPGAALVGPGAGQGCAEEDEEEDAPCRGDVPGASLGSRTGGSPQQGGSACRPSQPHRPWCENRGPAEGTLGKSEADAQVLPLKPEFVFQASTAESPRRQRGGPSWSLRGQGGCGEPYKPVQAVASPRVWRHCPHGLSPAGASRGAAAPLAQPPCGQTRHTEAERPPRGCGAGMEPQKGWSRQPQDQAAPKNQVSEDGSKPPPVLRAAFPHQNASTAARLHITPSASKKILPGRSRAAPHGAGGPGSRCSPAHFLGIWTLAYSEPVSSGCGAGRLGALLRCTMSRSA